MKVLVTGGNGQLGRCLQDRLQDTDYEWQAPDKNSLDITDRSAIATYFKMFQPDIVINAAAYTAVDKAESDQENAYLVNATAPGYLAESCQTAAIPLIHISTDYVFDGTATVPYKVSDQTNPQSVYGSTKLAGERIVQSTLSKHIIIRTSWVFSEYGNNFVKTMLRLANSHQLLKVIDDQYGCPTYAGDLARTILTIVEKISSGDLNWGVFHYSGYEMVNWYEFSRYILNKAYISRVIGFRPDIIPINSEEYVSIAYRPRFSVLNCNLIKVTFGESLSDWKDQVNQILLNSKIGLSR